MHELSMIEYLAGCAFHFSDRLSSQYSICLPLQESEPQGRGSATQPGGDEQEQSGVPQPEADPRPRGLRHPPLPRLPLATGRCPAMRLLPPQRPPHHRPPLARIAREADIGLHALPPSAPCWDTRIFGLTLADVVSKNGRSTNFAASQ